MAGDLRDLFNSSKKKKKKNENDTGFFPNDERFGVTNQSEWDDFFETTFRPFEGERRERGEERSGNSNRPKKKRKNEREEDENEVVSIEYEEIVPIFRKEVSGSVEGGDDDDDADDDDDEDEEELQV